MPEKIARVIVTFDCSRNCDYCVNKDPGTMFEAKVIAEIEQVAYRRQIIITGGEPAEYKPLINVLTRIKELNPAGLVYLYSASFNDNIKKALPFIDGFTFTLHDHYITADLNALIEIQQYPGILDRILSMRLCLGPNITKSLPITPAVWEQIKVKTWKKRGEPCLPDPEDLYVLTGTNHA